MTTPRLVLALVATDKTFCMAEHGSVRVWSGKCLHCNARLVVSLAGQLQGSATIEHILPRSHGGDDALHNLGLACARCNNLKGRRLDSQRRGHPRLMAVVRALHARRLARWRPPDPSLG